jgi:hypothetical protein
MKTYIVRYESENEKVNALEQIMATLQDECYLIINHEYLSGQIVVTVKLRDGKVMIGKNHIVDVMAGLRYIKERVELYVGNDKNFYMNSRKKNGS